MYIQYKERMICDNMERLSVLATGYGRSNYYLNRRCQWRTSLSILAGGNPCIKPLIYRSNSGHSGRQLSRHLRLSASPASLPAEVRTLISCAKFSVHSYILQLIPTYYLRNWLEALNATMLANFFFKQWREMKAPLKLLTGRHIGFSPWQRFITQGDFKARSAPAPAAAAANTARIEIMAFIFWRLLRL